MWDLASASGRLVCVHQGPSWHRRCDELAWGSEVERLPEEPGNKHFPITTSAWWQQGRRGNAQASQYSVQRLDVNAGVIGASEAQVSHPGVWSAGAGM